MLIQFVLCGCLFVRIQNVEMCPTCYEKFGHEHTVRKCTAEHRAMAKSGDTTTDVIRRCIETVAHAAACTQGTLCPRQPECRKMMDVLRHARACTTRTSCTVCQQLMALCVTHARACTIDSAVCRVPFCAELRRHIQRRQTLQRQQQHQMDDRRRAVMTGMDNDDLVPVSDNVEIHCTDSDASHHSVGKGGDTPRKSICGVVSASETTLTNITSGQGHLTASEDASCHKHCAATPGVAESSTLVSTELKTANYSSSQISTDLSGKTMHVTDSVPKTIPSNINDGQFVGNQFGGDGQTLEVLQTTESSARHQIVVGCLRVLKKLHPSMSKQNLLQLLCHCSRQQLTALQDKVNTF